LFPWQDIRLHTTISRSDSGGLEEGSLAASLFSPASSGAAGAATEAASATADDEAEAPLASPGSAVAPSAVNAVKGADRDAYLAFLWDTTIAHGKRVRSGGSAGEGGMEDDEDHGEGGGGGASHAGDNVETDDDLDGGVSHTGRGYDHVRAAVATFSASIITAPR
jgi:hypothetical protein